MTRVNRMVPFTLATSAGTLTFDPRAVYEATKAAFLADYADDPAVAIKIRRNGDLAEMEYTESIKGLSPERCATATQDEIERSMGVVARLALCSLALGYKKSKRKVSA